MHEWISRLRRRTDGRRQLRGLPCTMWSGYKHAAGVRGRGLRPEVTSATQRAPAPPPRSRWYPRPRTAGMISKFPVLDLFIGRDGDAWRLYGAARSWKPMPLVNRMDERGSVFPVAKRDIADLDRFMWNVDSP